MPKRGKKYQEAASKIDHLHPYPPTEAIALAKETAPAKFDETVEMHIRTGLDPRHADQQIRGTALLPHGLGKEVRVLVFAEGAYSATDPAVKALRRLLPPLPLGAVRLDLAFPVLMIITFVLMGVLRP